MEKWTASSLIANLPPYDKDPSSAKVKALSQFYVTLHLFGLQRGIFIEDLGPRCWEYTTNYLMYRYPKMSYDRWRKVTAP